jgi:hypothetical protein
MNLEIHHERAGRRGPLRSPRRRLTPHTEPGASWPSPRPVRSLLFRLSKKRRNRPYALPNDCLPARRTSGYGTDALSRSTGVRLPAGGGKRTPECGHRWPGPNRRSFYRPGAEKERRFRWGAGTSAGLPGLRAGCGRSEPPGKWRYRARPKGRRGERLMAHSSRPRALVSPQVRGAWSAKGELVPLDRSGEARRSRPVRIGRGGSAFSTNHRAVLVLRSSRFRRSGPGGRGRWRRR